MYALYLVGRKSSFQKKSVSNYKTATSLNFIFIMTIVQIINLCYSGHARRGRGCVAWEMEGTRVLFVPEQPSLPPSPAAARSSFHRIAQLFKTEMSGLGINRERLIKIQQIKGTDNSSSFAACSQF